MQLVLRSTPIEFELYVQVLHARVTIEETVIDPLPPGDSNVVVVINDEVGYLWHFSKMNL